MTSLSPDRAAARGFYSPQLDGLRFCAAMAVFVHHAPALPGLGALKHYGWIGVDLFLAISAFLLVRLLSLEHAATGRIDLRAFFVRRALRIWPLYLGFATAACAVAAASGATAPGETLAWWLSHLFFVNNLLTAVAGYAPTPGAAHLWTISLEEQVYLVLPFVVLGLRAGGVTPEGALRLAAALVVALIGARAAFVLAGIEHPFIWVSPLRGDAFVLGAAAALLPVRPPRRPLLLGAAGLGLMASVALFPPVEVPGAYQLVGYTVTALGCALVVAASQGDVVARSPLAAAPMRLMGKTSFGFYVYHLACIEAARALDAAVGLGPEATFAVALAATVIAALLSYRFLETPFLRLKARFARIESRPV